MTQVLHSLSPGLFTWQIEEVAAPILCTLHHQWRLLAAHR